jgi:hypothetical protein
MKKQIILLATVTSLSLFSQNNKQLTVPPIPVIVHVIHGGQSIGTYPNLSQEQIYSQIQVLNKDFAGIGYGTSSYPPNAFTSWATNTFVAASSIDGSGRIKIANTGISFCLVTQDSLGNLLPEAGIDRINYNSISAPLTGTFTSKNPAAPVYNATNKFQAFMDNYIKPATTWNCSKYLNIWISDANNVVALTGYAYFPVASTLPGLTGGIGTKNTDGLWCWANCFGSVIIYPGGTYQAGFDLGRSATHEIGHYLGLLHTFPCGFDDYCNDTPNAMTSLTVASCSTTYPYLPGSCTSPVSNAPDGEMFMNFMDKSDHCAMYMFTQDQTNRMQTALLNSPYRKFLFNPLCLAPTNISEETFAVNELTIFPNPTSDVVTITKKGSDIGKVEVYNCVGSLMYSADIKNNKAQISLTPYANGIYFVRIGTTTRGILKQ